MNLVTIIEANYSNGFVIKLPSGKINRFGPCRWDEDPLWKVEMDPGNGALDLVRYEKQNGDYLEISRADLPKNIQFGLYNQSVFWTLNELLEDFEGAPGLMTGLGSKGAESNTPKQDSSGTSSPADRRHQIIVCDNNEEMVKVVSEFLEEEDYAVSKAYDGTEALALISSKPQFYDLILIDHVMPHLGGLGLVKELRQLNFPGKIIVLSGHLDKLVYREYKNLAVDGIMMKPYYMNALLEYISTLLEAPQDTSF